ncbi:MAG: serine protease [Ponticaulis sp.]|nr:serine protease [Ponticaulis sp.]
MKIPDWFIYAVVLSAVLYGLFSRNQGELDAPPSLPEELEVSEIPLPAPSRFDEEVLVEVGDRAGPSVGTAFSISSEGMWLTARHVVDGCSNLMIRVGPNRIVPVERYETLQSGDLALLYTEGAADPAQLDLEANLNVGQPGFHIGFPQGRPGEVTSKLLSRSRMTSRGKYNVTEPVLAWAESGRTRNLNGSLGGISGGPLFDSAGEVIGVTVAESPRRGRIYTTAPSTIRYFLATEADYQPQAGETRPISTQNYGGEGDRLRRNLTVVKVHCPERY